jgi:hypothetical protein
LLFWVSFVNISWNCAWPNYIDTCSCISSKGCHLLFWIYCKAYGFLPDALWFWVWCFSCWSNVDQNFSMKTSSPLSKFWFQKMANLRNIAYEKHETCILQRLKWSAFVNEKTIKCLLVSQFLHTYHVVHGCLVQNNQSDEICK